MKLSEKIEQYRLEGEASGQGQVDTALAQFRDEARQLEGLILPNTCLEDAIHHAREVAADSSYAIDTRIGYQKLVEWLTELERRRSMDGRVRFAHHLSDDL